MCGISFYACSFLSHASFFLCLTFSPLPSSQTHTTKTTTCFVIMTLSCCVNYSICSKDLVPHCPIWGGFSVQFSGKWTGKWIQKNTCTGIFCDKMNDVSVVKSHDLMSSHVEHIPILNTSSLWVTVSVRRFSHLAILENSFSKHGTFSTLVVNYGSHSRIHTEIISLMSTERCGLGLVENKLLIGFVVMIKQSDLKDQATKLYHS